MYNANESTLFLCLVSLPQRMAGKCLSSSLNSKTSICHPLQQEGLSKCSWAKHQLPPPHLTLNEVQKKETPKKTHIFAYMHWIQSRIKWLCVVRKALPTERRLPWRPLRPMAVVALLGDLHALSAGLGRPGVYHSQWVHWPLWQSRK